MCVCAGGVAGVDCTLVAEHSVMAPALLEKKSLNYSNFIIMSCHTLSFR